MFSAGAKAAAKLKKKLKRNARIKAHADDLAERYKRILESEARPETVHQILKPFVKEATLKDFFKLPVIEAIDFEAMAQDAKAKKEFLQAVKSAAEREEEEMTLILTLAAM